MEDINVQPVGVEVESQLFEQRARCDSRNDDDDYQHLFHLLEI